MPDSRKVVHVFACVVALGWTVLETCKVRLRHHHTSTEPSARKKRMERNGCDRRPRGLDVRRKKVRRTQAQHEADTHVDDDDAKRSTSARRLCSTQDPTRETFSCKRNWNKQNER